MSFAFWAWIVVAVVCALGECVTGGLLTLPWAVGAFVAALLEAAGIVSGWQWIAFVLVSSILLVAGQRLIVRRQAKDAGQSTTNRPAVRSWRDVTRRRG